MIDAAINHLTKFIHLLVLSFFCIAMLVPALAAASYGPEVASYGQHHTVAIAEFGLDRTADNLTNQVIESFCGSTVDQPLRFPGQYFDSESGLHYNLNRYYDPDTGRYLSVDPVVENTRGLIIEYAKYEPNALQPYSYARNNPNSYVDPDGAFGIPGAAAGAVAGGAAGAYYGAIGGYLGTLAGGGSLSDAIGNAALGLLGGGAAGAAVGGASGAVGNPLGALLGGGALGGAIGAWAGGSGATGVGLSALCGALGAATGSAFVGGSLAAACGTLGEAIDPPTDDGCEKK